VWVTCCFCISNNDDVEVAIVFSSSGKRVVLIPDLYVDVTICRV
jgi:hypothetical protein